MVEHVPGTAGSSARREYERRKAKDEERIREKWGRLGNLAVSLSDQPQHTTAWKQGAIGEERLGAQLDTLAGDRFAILHDRRIPGSKANIDHIATSLRAEWPLIGGAFSTQGVQVIWPRRLARILGGQTAGSLDVAGTRELIAGRLNPA